MPIHIDVRVNDRPIKSLHIGRESGGTDADDLNTYVIMETAFGDTPLRWDYTTRPMCKDLIGRSLTRTSM